ncbi:MAG TPA: hypothetical protein VFB34_07760 [Chloroflexota bacterium]|nr:hypothetical protein [Chloroflexota bacterium]
MISLRRTSRLFVAAISAVAVTLATSGASPANTRSPAPALKLTGAKGYRLAVAGSGWPASSRVTFRLTQGAFPVEGFELITTKRGQFEIGVNNIDLCNGEMLTARDLAGHSVGIPGPGLACPVRKNPPAPVLTILVGQPANISVRHIDWPSQRGPVTIRLADAVYLWEGKSGFLPSAPWKSFQLIQRGTTPPRDCPEVECAAGFYWEWVGMAVGNTGIAMNPRCAPKCEIASYLIPVKIVSRNA